MSQTQFCTPKHNLGLTHHQGRGVHYSMYMGVAVADGLDTAKSQSRIKNNVFATGFLDGVPATRGCSAKGKFWSISSVRDLTVWIEWCEDIGRAVNVVDFHWELTRAPGVFPPRTDPCLNLAPLA